MLCDYCQSSDHDVLTCPFRIYIDATCAHVEKKIKKLTDKIIENIKVRIAEYSQCFHQSRENCNESDSSLGSSKPVVALYDDFEPSYLARSNLNEEMPSPSQEQESSLPTPLSPTLALEFRSPTDVIEDTLVSADPSAPFHHSFEFKEGDECGNPSELDLSIITNEHRDLD